jgi:hypothetical protein
VRSDADWTEFEATFLRAESGAPHPVTV